MGRREWRSQPGPKAGLELRAEVAQACVQGDARAPPGRLVSLTLLLRVHARPALIQQRRQLLIGILTSSLHGAQASELQPLRQTHAAVRIMSLACSMLGRSQSCLLSV